MNMDKLSETSPEALFNAFNQFRILSPLRQGPFGVNALNELFKRHFEKQAKHRLSFIAPITIMKNDAQFGLSNGEIGILIRQNREPQPFDSLFQEGDYALFIGEQGIVRSLPAILLPAFEYAYCMSVHKSQGSEFEHVLLLLPEGAEIFGKEGLYTGVTRAKKGLEIWSSQETFKKILMKHSHRLSGIKLRTCLALT
jgi:exodeoxyribonuclease V alpha subunit